MTAATGFDSIVYCRTGILSLCVVACVGFDSLDRPARPYDFADCRDVRSDFAMVLSDLPPNAGHMMMLEQPESFSEIVCAMNERDVTANRTEAMRLPDLVGA